MTGAQNIDISGNVGKNLVIGDHNLLIEVSGSLVFNAAESAKRQQRDLRKMLRVLVVLAGPVFDPHDPERDPTPLDLLAEWQRLSDAVRASGAPIALIRLAPPTLDSLRYALSPRAVEQGLYPHVLHFGGHAWKNGLLFEDEYGGEDPVITPRLLDAFQGVPPLDLAVFNACDSAENALSAAHLISTHSPKLFGDESLRLASLEAGEPLFDDRLPPCIPTTGTDAAGAPSNSSAASSKICL
jgi:hypothetical protein